MKEYTLFIDSGNRFSKAVLKQHEGTQTRRDGFSTIRAAVSGYRLNGISDQMEYAVYEDETGQKYVVGDDALSIADAAIRSHVGTDRYAGGHHREMVDTQVARLDVEKGAIVNLVLFVPAGMYEDHAPAIVDNFEDRTVTLHVTRVVKGKARTYEKTWTYGAVDIRLEGKSAQYAFILDSQGRKRTSKADQSRIAQLLSGSILLSDFGSMTINTIPLVNGQFNVEKLDDATHAEMGGQFQVFTPVWKMARRMHPDWKRGLTLEHIEAAFRAGQTTGSYYCEYGSYGRDLSPEFKQVGEQYAFDVVTKIYAPLFQGLSAYRYNIVFGGFAALVYPYLRDWYNDRDGYQRVLIPGEMPDEVALANDISPLDLNVEAAAREYMARQKAD